MAVGAVSSEPVSHVDKRIKDECENPGSIPEYPASESASRIPGSSRMIPDYPGLKLGSCLAERVLAGQRLTGRATELGRAEARSAVRGRGVPGGSHVRPTRTTETGPRDDRPHTGATSLQTCLVFSAPRPRPSKSPGIHRKNLGPPPSDPGVRASAGLGGGGGSLERTRLARRQTNKRRILDGSLLCPASNSLTGSGGVSWRVASVPPHRRISGDVPVAVEI